MSDYSVGDMVRFADVHHAHNTDLKRWQGQVGEVVAVDHGIDSKLLVEFGGLAFERYRLDPDRVELVELSGLGCKLMTDDNSTGGSERFWKFVKICADARYIEGYLSTAYSDDEHIHGWASNHADELEEVLDEYFVDMESEQCGSGVDER